MSNPMKAHTALSNSHWKLIACDLDGTLIGRNHKINDRDLDALRAARAAGIHIAICTGRIPHESAGVIAALELTGPGVFATGALVSDMANGHTLHSRPLPAPLVQSAIDFFGSQGHAALALVDHPNTHLPAYFLTDHAPLHNATKEWLLLNRMHATSYHEIPPACANRVIRLGVVVDPSDAPLIEAGLHARFADQITWHSMRSPYFDCQIIELFTAVTTKWTGIQDIAQLLQILPSQVITIGDDINDVPMLRSASLSFAMGNAAREIQANAKRITASQPDCGVAQVIDQLLAGQLDP
jgi:Cof subfamily protein (haloacid dehalogenase superfamily)